MPLYYQDTQRLSRIRYIFSERFQYQCRQESREQPAIPGFALLRAQRENSLPYQGIGGESSHKKRAIRWSVTQNGEQRGDPQTKGEQGFQQLGWNATRAHPLIGRPHAKAGRSWWSATATSKKAADPTCRHCEQHPWNSRVKENPGWHTQQYEQERGSQRGTGDKALNAPAISAMFRSISDDIPIVLPLFFSLVFLLL
jgi:hypothetical protein